MREHELRGLLASSQMREEKVGSHLRQGLLIRREPAGSEISGHAAKAGHNLQFTADALRWGYTDWALVGCYYAAYHMALALILTKGYFSKNHDATLCALIKEYYRASLTAEDLALFNNLYLDEHDILFYVQSWQERERASYSSKLAFERRTVEDILLKTRLFVSKCRSMLGRL